MIEVSRVALHDLSIHNLAVGVETGSQISDSDIGRVTKFKRLWLA